MEQETAEEQEKAMEQDDAMAPEEPLTSPPSLAKERAEYDAHCKRILSEKSILGWILHGCASEYADCTPREIAEKYIEGQPQVSVVPVEPDGNLIRGRGQEDVSPEEGGVFFDLCFDALAPGTGEPIQLIINVEAQKAFYPGYPLLKRGVFYCGRLLSAQKGTVFSKSHYEKLRKVYSIWICMDPPKNRENTITRYHMAEENLWGTVREDAEHYDLLTILMVCLGPPDQSGGNRTLKLLDTALSNVMAAEEKKRVLAEEFQIPVTAEFEKEVSVMKHPVDAAWEKGRKEGKAEGKAEGRAEGKAEGKAETLSQSVQNLMKNLGLTLDKAMDALSIPDGERAACAEQLGRL